MANRPWLRTTYPYIMLNEVNKFIDQIELLSVRIQNPPPVFTLPRDSNDEPFINLVVAGNADFIVTWNERHLTYLMKQDTPEGVDFCTKFPTIKILSPPDFLATFRRLDLPPPTL